MGQPGTMPRPKDSRASHRPRTRAGPVQPASQLDEHRHRSSHPGRPIAPGTRQNATQPPGQPKRREARQGYGGLTPTPRTTATAGDSNHQGKDAVNRYRNTADAPAQGTQPQAAGTG